MPKPGKTAERHRQHHLVDKSGDIPRPPWVEAFEASQPEWDETEVFPFYVNEEWDGQVYQRVRRHPDTRQVVDFAAAIQMQPAGTDEGFVDVARIDCAHGEVHIHSGSGEKAARDSAGVPPDCRENLDRAHMWALDYVWDIPARLKGLA